MTSYHLSFEMAGIEMELFFSCSMQKLVHDLVEDWPFKEEQLEKKRFNSVISKLKGCQILVYENTENVYSFRLFR